MIPLYSIWGADKLSANPNTIGNWGQIWCHGEKVELPLPWAKAYAQELNEVNGLPTEVRNRDHKVCATYGMDKL